MRVGASAFGLEGRAHTLEEALWLVSSFSALHRRAFNAALFAQRYPPPISDHSLQQAADELGLIAETRRCSLKAALSWRLPVAVRLRASDESPANTSADKDDAASWALVLNAGDTHVSLLVRGAEGPVATRLSDLEHRYLGEVLALAPQPVDAADPDSLQFQAGRFGLRWFVPELLKHRRIWRDVLLASLVLQLMALATPLFTQVIIDKVVVHRTESTLIALGAGMAVFLLFTSALTWIRQHLVLHTGRRIDAVLGSHVFNHLLRLPLVYFQTRPTGVIAARLQGIETVREFIASTAVTLALDLPFLLVFLAIMFWYSTKLTLIVLAILVLITGTSLLIAPVFQRRLNEQFRRGAANQAFLTEYIAGMETVKSLQLEPQLNLRYRDLLAELLKSGISARQLANTYNTWASTLDQLSSTLVLIVGAWIVMTTSTLTVGMLVAFQMFSSRISQPLLRMVGLWQQWQQTRLSIARLGDVMNAPTESYNLVPRRGPATGAARIEMEGLAFRYNEQLPMLFEDFSLLVPPGQLTVIMGPSGAGKSTLAKLLQGFYAPSRGRIRIDGIDHNHLSANELRSTFGVVPQETVLFSGTLLENLKLANPYASFEQVVAACKMAEIHSAIDSLPGGYQTLIGERGVGLSGGQRQRLSIARALLKGPKVLLFDEATSSVDPLTAEQLGRTINALKGRVTILFIAHQLPRSLQVDQVVRIGDKLAVVNPDRHGEPEGEKAATA
ncbi:MAG: peptidase domain-containing ABC transporter [Proteobacteria bacterium]|nr:peptidase domain-containing ABC transporter [Pseudomonadota bacterium]